MFDVERQDGVERALPVGHALPRQAVDEVEVEVVEAGGAASGGNMAPLGDALSAEQEAAVLEFVHSLWSDEQRLAHEDAGGHAP